MDTFNMELSNELCLLLVKENNVKWGSHIGFTL